MLKRVFPILLLENDELIKTVQFGKPTYIGDIINAVKIFNELEVDEIFILDKSAKTNGINYSFLQDIVTEAFMPVTYSGNIDNLEKIEKVLCLGIEKVAICGALRDLNFINAAVKKFGTSTIAACIDYRIENDQRIVYINNGKTTTGESLETIIESLQSIGIGELILQCIDKDGTYSGYDQEVFSRLSKVKNPIVIAGGCKDFSDIKSAFQNGASACAVGSLFVYYTDTRGILINYLAKEELEQIQSEP